jgi:hypothetical protein
LALTPSRRIDDQDLAKKVIELQNQVGGFVKMAHIANLSAAPTQADFNGLLAALQTAGLMA